ncbi:hypothetical protein AXF42_Ash020018 [Apostasia shenzhenica]|uniref:Uncharacterized protein n=1 Tax=Apostasia shenzhenica TaxID=1088818 RepID=A0A2H9ZSJ9_9ASPA|nr:hypothetical protein AXF42_Ash020018 [Apostasia shenzhenica]
MKTQHNQCSNISKVQLDVPTMQAQASTNAFCETLLSQHDDFEIIDLSSTLEAFSYTDLSLRKY